MLIGDDNGDFLTRNPKQFCLENVLGLFGLIQVITEPSRITNSSTTLIDVIAVSGLLPVVGKGSMDMLNVCDHLLVWCSLAVVPPKKHPRVIT